MPTFNENVILGNGNRIGVGTTTPTEPVHVVGALRVVNDGDGVALLHLDSERGWVFRQHGSGASTALQLTGNRASNNNKNFLITTDGNVGIGTTAPTARLHVEGSIKSAYDVTAARRIGIGTDSPQAELDVRGSIRVRDDVILSGADCAEEFDLEPASRREPGTVMVIGPDRRLVHCASAYDKRVAGVVSGAGDRRPGIVLGRRRDRSGTARVPVALSGTVNCWVDATEAPVDVGDLLTTSPTPGHAMRATDSHRSFGAVIGKALDGLRGGIGTVPVLVTLH